MYKKKPYAPNATDIGIALSGGAWTTNWGNGPIIYVNNTPGDTYEGVFGFQNKTNYTDGRITALKRLDVSGSVNIQNTSLSICESNPYTIEGLNITIL